MLCFNTDQNTTAFKEVAIIRHPRVGEYAFGFITSTVLLQVLIYLYTLFYFYGLSVVLMNHHLLY
jgi:hypothetical protein